MRTKKEILDLFLNYVDSEIYEEPYSNMHDGIIRQQADIFLERFSISKKDKILVDLLYTDYSLF